MLAQPRSIAVCGVVAGLVAGGLVAVPVAPAAAVGPWLYEYSGVEQTWTAPSTGVYKVEVVGAGGGSGTGSAGGAGAVVTSYQTVTAGTQWLIRVGGGTGFGSGGAASAVVQGTTPISIAGGGGGGGGTSAEGGSGAANNTPAGGDSGGLPGHAGGGAPGNGDGGDGGDGQDLVNQGGAGGTASSHTGGTGEVQSGGGGGYGGAQSGSNGDGGAGNAGSLGGGPSDVFASQVGFYRGGGGAGFGGGGGLYGGGGGGYGGGGGGGTQTGNPEGGGAGGSYVAATTRLPSQPSPAYQPGPITVGSVSYGGGNPAGGGAGENGMVRLTFIRAVSTPGPPRNLKVSGSATARAYQVTWRKSLRSTSDTRYVLHLSRKGSSRVLLTKRTAGLSVKLTRKQILRATFANRGDYRYLDYIVTVYAHTGPYRSRAARAGLRLLLS